MNNILNNILTERLAIHIISSIVNSSWFYWTQIVPLNSKIQTIHLVSRKHGYFIPKPMPVEKQQIQLPLGGDRYSKVKLNEAVAV